MFAVGRVVVGGGGGGAHDLRVTKTLHVNGAVAKYYQLVNVTWNHLKYRLARTGGVTPATPKPKGVTGRQQRHKRSSYNKKPATRARCVTHLR